MHDWGDLRIDGFIQGKQVISKSYSGKGIDQKLLVMPDDLELLADGADTTRVVFRAADEFDQVRPFANDALQLTLEGPAQIVGDNPFALVGGTGAVWVRAGEQGGTATLRVTHPVLGTQTVTFTLRSVPSEEA